MENTGQVLETEVSCPTSHLSLATLDQEGLAMRRELSKFSRHLSSSPAPSLALAGGPELIVERGCSWSKIGEAVAGYGRVCLAVVGDGNRAVEQAQRSLFELRKVGINCAVFTARGAYPTAEAVDEARAMARRVGAMSVVGIGVGCALDTAKATAMLHNTSGKCKSFVQSPGNVMMTEGSHGDPPTPAGEGLPLVMVPSAAGAGACANDRCLIWHPEDEVLVPMAPAPGKRDALSVSLIDAELCSSISRENTVAMALTAVSACLDAILAVELGCIGTSPETRDNLLELGVRGIGEVGMGLPRALAGKDVAARELLSSASLCAGQLSAITPAPATQILARAAGSLLCRHSYPSVCSTVFPHVVGDMIEQANSFSSDAEMSEAMNRALCRAAMALLGRESGEALVSWLDNLQQQRLLKSSLSDLDSMVTVKEVAMNMETLLAIEEDAKAGDRLFSGGGILTVVERAIG